jgi:nicotinamidase/pyrazinamidase
VVIYTRDWHPPGHISFAETHNCPPFTTIKINDDTQVDLWPLHCVQDTTGAAFHEELTLREARVVVNKGEFLEEEAYSGFGTDRHPT